MNVKVLLVDDNKNFIKAFKHLILSVFSERISVIDEAYNGSEAIDLIESKHAYDIVFLDIDMPGKNGYEVARYINRHYPYVKIVAVSWHEELEVFTKMFSAGAYSFIVKDKLNLTLIEKAFYSIKGFRL
ncbi:MAG: response regulator transcription factor [Breznakibacter sp.]